jgi:signal transduction histidine kinase
MSTASVSPPITLDFAAEVKIDRLKVLWKATLAAALILGWLVLTLVAVNRGTVIGPFVPFMILVIGCLACRIAVNRDRYNLAAWLYSLGAMLAVVSAFFIGDVTVTQVAPFVMPVIVFMVGLLLPPAHTLFAAIAAIAAIIFGPFLATGDFGAFDVFDIAAIGLVILATALAIQVTGDLYQVTGWALDNYQRERRTASDLFDNRQALERALRRSEALSESLQDANAALDAARTAAEEAKHYRGQFLANMSHELRTPLNAIIGFSETMLKFPAMYDGVKLPPAYEDDLQQIYASGRQLLNLINDILDLSKVDAGKLDVRMDRVDIAPLVYNVVNTASGLVGAKPITLNVDLPDYLPLAYADRSRVSQVLLNLYSNAAKFTDEGDITVSVRNVAEGILFSVRDTGSGIPADSLEAVFEEFKQAESGGRDPRSGAGLGLAISRQLLTLMGGRIWAESEPGVGSTFHFIVQRYPEQVVDEGLETAGETGAAQAEYSQVKAG